MDTQNQLQQFCFAGTHYCGMQVLQLLKEALRYEVQTAHTSCDQSEALKDRECAEGL